jgi:hypothetical protein
MFDKHIYVTATGDYREKNDGTNYYIIWEISERRPIDTDNYALYLDWIAAGNTPPVVDVTPDDPEPPVATKTLEQVASELNDLSDIVLDMGLGL